MTPDQLTDIREWSARVCGAEKIRDVWFDAQGMPFLLDSWRPDEYIAQAFEVLDAVAKNEWYEVGSPGAGLSCGALAR